MTTKEEVPKEPGRFRSALRHGLASIAFFLCVLLILIVILWKEVFITVPSGSVGVIWYRFFGGTVTERHLGEGLKVILPWDKIFVYSVRPQLLDFQMSALTGEGLTVDLKVTATSVIMVHEVGFLHKAVGPEYQKTLVEPIIAEALRALLSSYRADQIYDFANNSLEFEVTERVNERIQDASVNFGDQLPLVRLAQFNLRSVHLPKDVSEAIEEKVRAQQAVARYEFVLERERLESDRKAIEADGVRRFQEIVTPTISQEYLQWRGIDATLQLALSNNAKVVVIGAGDDGLPLIFDGTTDTGPSVTNKNDVTPEYGSSLEMLEEAERETGLQTQDNTRP